MQNKDEARNVQDGMGFAFLEERGYSEAEALRSVVAHAIIMWIT